MKFTSKLRKAVDNARSALDMHGKLSDALARAVSMQPAAEAKYQRLLEENADAESAALLSDSQPDAKGRQSLADAQTAVDSIDAGIAGLRRRLAVHEPILANALNDLDVARGEFAGEQLEEYRRMLTSAASEFSAVLRHGTALASALGLTGLESSIRDIRLADPTRGVGHAFLIDMTALVWSEESRCHVPSGMPWANDAVAESVFRSNREPADLAAEIRKALEVPLPIAA